MGGLLRRRRGVLYGNNVCKAINDILLQHQQVLFVLTHTLSVYCWHRRGHHHPIIIMLLHGDHHEIMLIVYGSKWLISNNRWFIILISIFRLIVCKKNIRLHIRNTYTYLHRIVSSSLSHAILSFCILIQPSYPFLMCLCVGPTRPYLSYLCTPTTIHFIFWIEVFEQTH